MAGKVRFPSARRLACLCVVACAIAGVVVAGAKLTEPYFARRAEKKLCHSLVDSMLHADDLAERRAAAGRLELRCSVQGRAESRVELVPGEPDARRVDWRYLRVIDDDYVIDAFLEVVENRDEELLGSAISGLSFSQAARPEITDILASIVESEDRPEVVRWVAAKALVWGNGGESALRASLELLEELTEPDIIVAILFPLGASAWSDGLAETRGDARQLRGRIFHRLVELARHSADESVRAEALAAAALPGGYPERRDSVISLARSALDTDDSPRVRRQAVFALADWGLDGPEARELLARTAASDPDPGVREAASRSIARTIRESVKASQKALF